MAAQNKPSIFCDAGDHFVSVPIAHHGVKLCSPDGTEELHLYGSLEVLTALAANLTETVGAMAADVAAASPAQARPEAA